MPRTFLVIRFERARSLFVRLATRFRDRRQLARLQRALATLPADAREVFVLHRIERLSADEIAQTTGRLVADVEQLIVGALVALVRQENAHRYDSRR